MNTFLKHILTVPVILFIVTITACTDEPPLPDNSIQFESSALGMGADENELNIIISLSREATSATTVSIELANTSLTYGIDYETVPAATANQLTLPISAGSVEVSFLLKKVNGVLFDGDEEIVFTIPAAPETLVLGEKNPLTLSFAEIVSASGTVDINGGGDTYPNKVFIGFSANRQVAVARTSWDFAFSSGDDFRVALNASNGMMARVTTKNDMNAVTAQDTVGFGVQLSLPAVFSPITTNAPAPWVSEATNWIDAPSGDLTKTTIPQVSATGSENKVIIVNLGNGPGTPATELGWKKIRVVRNGNGYTLQHANINATSFSEIQISKNNAYTFQFASLANGVVEVEPMTPRWDIAWTGFSNETNFGSGPVPYYFQDVILQNTAGVETVQVMTSTKSYEAFGESDIPSLDFANQSQVKIGSSWRSGGGPGMAPAIRSDRFYVIKDADGNYYKVKFTALTTSGERGKPKLAYELIKEGE